MVKNGKEAFGVLWIYLQIFSRFTNIFFIAPMFTAFISINDSTFACNRSLSFGAIRRLSMVCPPLKCTCTPNLLHVLFILSLRPWWYGTTMYRLFWLVFGPVCVLLVLLVLRCWLFILALLMAQVGLFASGKGPEEIFFCNSWVLSKLYLLYERVPATLYFDGIVWWLSHWRYKSVWVFFLNTDVLRLPSSSV